MNNDQVTKESISERLRRRRQELDEFRAEAQARARRAVRVTNNYAHDHPWRMVITGVALAFAAGLLMPRARARSKKVEFKPKSAGPTIKIKKERSSAAIWEALHALTPLALLGLKAYQSRAAEPPPKVDTSAPVM